MTVAARLAALLLRATADALDAFAHSVKAQRVRCPDRLPAWVDDGSAPL